MTCRHRRKRIGQAEGAGAVTLTFLARPQAAFSQRRKPSLMMVVRMLVRGLEECQKEKQAQNSAGPDKGEGHICLQSCCYRLRRNLHQSVSASELERARSPHDGKNCQTSTEV